MVPRSALVALALGACSSAQPPDKPTWVDDVHPIIQGSCGHCHGPTAEITANGYRLDVCDSFVFADTGHEFGKNCGTKMADASCDHTGAGTMSQATLIRNDVTPGSGSAAAMPPPPGGPLSDYEREVLVRWVAQGFPCGTRPGNHKPTLKLIGKPKYSGTEVAVTVEVTDADGDQVLGSIFVGPDCDPTSAGECMMRARGSITHSGRSTISFSGVADGAALAARFSDGWTTVAKDL